MYEVSRVLVRFGEFANDVTFHFSALPSSYALFSKESRWHFTIIEMAAAFSVVCNLFGRLKRLKSSKQNGQRCERGGDVSDDKVATE